MITELIRVAEALEATGTTLPTPYHPHLSVNKNLKLCRIDREGNLISISDIPQEDSEKLYKINPVKDGKFASVSFPIITFDVKNKTIIEEQLIKTLLPDLIKKFSKYTEMKNFVELMEVFSKHFDFDKFSKQYQEMSSVVLSNEGKKAKKVIGNTYLFFDLDSFVDGYFVSNTQYWKQINEVLYKEYPIKSGEVGQCWFSPTIEPKPLALTEKMDILTSKKIFTNGLSLYNKNTKKFDFSWNGKIQISEELYKKIKSSAAWILGEERVNKNSYPIKLNDLILVCYLTKNPLIEFDFASLICENTDQQSNVEDEIKKLMTAVLITGKEPASTMNELSYFILQRTNPATVIVQGEGIVPIEKLINSLNKWNFGNFSFCSYLEKMNRTIGLKRMYEILNRQYETNNQSKKTNDKSEKIISFYDLINGVFFDTDVMLCQKLLNNLNDRYWKDIIDCKHKLENGKKSKDLFTINEILLTIKLLQTKIMNEESQQLKCVGNLLQFADKLNKYYNLYYLKNSGEQHLLGYETVRMLNNGQLSQSLSYLMGRLTKYMAWAEQHGSKKSDEKVGLIKWLLKNTKLSICGCDGVIEKYSHRLLTVNEKTTVLMAYMGDIKIETESSTPKA